MAIGRGGDSGRREQILDKAVSLLSVRGIEGVRLQDVSDISGASIGAIQHYFGSREDLIDEALGLALQETVTMMRRAAEPTDDPWADLCRLAEGYETVGNRQDRAKIWISLINSAMHSERHRVIARTINAEWAKLFREVLTRGQEMGVFRLAHSLETSILLLLRLIDGTAVSDAADLENGAPQAGGVLALASYLVGQRAVDDAV